MNSQTLSSLQSVSKDPQVLFNTTTTPTSNSALIMATYTSPKKRKTQIVDDLVSSPPQKKARKENVNPPRTSTFDPKPKLHPKQTTHPNPSPFKKFYEANGLRIPLYQKNGKRKSGARSAHSLAAKLNKNALLDIVEEYGGKAERAKLEGGNKNAIAGWIERVETIALGGNVRRGKTERGQDEKDGNMVKDDKPAPAPKPPAAKQKAAPTPAPTHRDKVFAKPKPSPVAPAPAAASIPEIQVNGVKKRHVTNAPANEPRKRHQGNKKADFRRRHGKEHAKHSAAANKLHDGFSYQLPEEEDEDDEDEEETSDDEELAPEKEPQVMNVDEPIPVPDPVEFREMGVDEIIRETGVHPMITALGLDPCDPLNCTIIIRLPKTEEHVVVTASSWTTVHQTKIPFPGRHVHDQGGESDEESVVSGAE